MTNNATSVQTHKVTVTRPDIKVYCRRGAKSFTLQRSVTQQNNVAKQTFFSKWRNTRVKDGGRLKSNTHKTVFIFFLTQEFFSSCFFYFCCCTKWYIFFCIQIQCCQGFEDDVCDTTFSTSEALCAVAIDKKKKDRLPAWIWLKGLRQTNKQKKNQRSDQPSCFLWSGLRKVLSNLRWDSDPEGAN